MNDLKSPMLADEKTVRKAPVPRDAVVKERTPNPIIKWFTTGNRRYWDWRHWFMVGCGVVIFISVVVSAHSQIFHHATIMNVVGYIATISIVGTFLYCMVSVDND